MLLAVRTWHVRAKAHLKGLVSLGVHLWQVPQQALLLVWVSEAKQALGILDTEKTVQFMRERNADRTNCRSKSWLRLALSCFVSSGPKLRYVKIHGTATSSQALSVLHVDSAYCNMTQNASTL